MKIKLLTRCGCESIIDWQVETDSSGDPKIPPKILMSLTPEIPQDEILDLQRKLVKKDD